MLGFAALIDRLVLFVRRRRFLASWQAELREGMTHLIVLIVWRVRDATSERSCIRLPWNAIKNTDIDMPIVAAMTLAAFLRRYW